MIGLLAVIKELAAVDVIKVHYTYCLLLIVVVQAYSVHRFDFETWLLKGCM